MVVQRPPCEREGERAQRCSGESRYERPRRRCIALILLTPSGFADTPLYCVEKGKGLVGKRGSPSLRSRGRCRSQLSLGGWVNRVACLAANLARIVDSSRRGFAGTPLCCAKRGKAAFFPLLYAVERGMSGVAMTGGESTGSRSIGANPARKIKSTH